MVACCAAAIYLHTSCSDLSAVARYALWQSRCCSSPVFAPIHVMLQSIYMQWQSPCCCNLRFKVVYVLWQARCFGYLLHGWSVKYEELGLLPNSVCTKKSPTIASQIYSFCARKHYSYSLWQRTLKTTIWALVT